MNIVSSRVLLYSCVVTIAGLLPMQQAHAQDPLGIELETVARISKDERVLSVDAVSRVHDGVLYLAVSSSKITGGSGGVGIVRVDINDNNATRWIFWHEFPPEYRSMPSHYASCVIWTSQNELILVAKLDGTTPFIIKLSSEGKVLAKQSLLDGAAGLDVLACVAGERDELLVVGHHEFNAFATLLSLDLKPLWRYRQEEAHHSIFHDAHYDRERERFVLAGIIAREEPDLETDDLLMTEAAVVIINREGEQVRMNSWGEVNSRGAHPGFVREGKISGERYLLLTDTGLQNESQITLTALSPELQVTDEQVLTESSRLSHPPAALLMSNQTLLLAWSAKLELHVRTQELFGKPLATQTIKRITLAPGPVYLAETEQGQLIISTIGDFPANRREALPATAILVESVEIHEE